MIFFISQANAQKTLRSGSIKCMQKVVGATPADFQDKKVTYQFLDSSVDAQGGVPTIIKHDTQDKKIEIIRPYATVKIDETRTDARCEANIDVFTNGISEGEKIARSFLVTYFYEKPNWVTKQNESTWHDTVTYCKKVFPEHQAFKSKAAKPTAVPASAVN